VEAKQDMGPLEHTYNAGACIMQNRGHDFIVIYTSLKNQSFVFTGLTLEDFFLTKYCCCRRCGLAEMERWEWQADGGEEGLRAPAGALARPLRAHRQWHQVRIHAKG
jgi:hypothetical protein